MISLSVKTEINMRKVTESVDRAAFTNLGHAAASIRKDVLESIERASGPSDPGTPPHTRRGQIERAIVYDYDRKEMNAVVGPRFSIVGLAGAAHEFGGEFRGNEYPERAFMEPALERNIDRFAREWEGSIGE